MVLDEVFFSDSHYGEVPALGPVGCHWYRERPRLDPATPAQPRETAQQLPNFPDQTEVKQETQQLLEKELQQGTKPDVLEKEELNDKTKRSQGLVNLKPEFAENEDFQAETKPSLSEREIEGVEEDLVPETKPVQRSKETEEKLEEEDESPQTKPSQRSTESKPETKPSPKFYGQRPIPEEFEHQQQRFIPRPVPGEEQKESKKLTDTEDEE
uniref:Neurofilament heavy polypeptide-like isoform X3 n=1 Tax=Crassostrea virginica TaxID=6565 RepID=A0A8B8EQU3_CRAVI|nr:neurofilament heavy polypeptide-like isoform X3 [Crassostrea virginica]